MIKRFLFLLATGCAAGSALGQQWTTSGNDIQNANSGRVGVGVAATAGKFQVFTSTDHGIFSQITSGNGYSAVYASISNANNQSPALFGYTNGTAGKAVNGWSYATTGSAAGVWGETEAADGYGVVGIAHANGGTGGTGIGVFARSHATSGYALYTDTTSGGRNYLGGNTGIGQSSPATKLHVTGSVRFDTIGTLSSGSATPLVVDSSGNVIKQLTTNTGAKEFRTTGTHSAWTVPGGVSVVRIRMWGGGGGSSGSATGGSGAHLQASLAVSAGNTLTFTVGAGGAGSNNGGATYFVSPGGCTFNAGGGTAASGGGGAGTASVADSGGSPPACAGSTFNVVTSSGLAGQSGVNFAMPAAYAGPVDSGTLWGVGYTGYNAVRGSHGAVVIEW